MLQVGMSQCPSWVLGHFRIHARVERAVNGHHALEVWQPLPVVCGRCQGVPSAAPVHACPHPVQLCWSSPHSLGQQGGCCTAGNKVTASRQGHQKEGRRKCPAWSWVLSPHLSRRGPAGVWQAGLGKASPHMRRRLVWHLREPKVISGCLKMATGWLGFAGYIALKGHGASAWTTIPRMPWVSPRVLLPSPRAAPPRQQRKGWVGICWSPPCPCSCPSLGGEQGRCGSLMWLLDRA